MTQKEFKIATELLDQIRWLQNNINIVGRGQIISMDLKYLDDQTKEYVTHTLDFKHSLPTGEIHKTILKNLRLREQNMLKNFSRTIKRVQEKDNQPILELNGTDNH